MRSSIALVLALLVAGCGADGSNVAAPESNGSAPEAAKAGTPVGNSQASGPQIPACPFRETEGWGGAIEGGRITVNGVVDLQMAGFRPALTERPGAAGGTLALDLALAPEPNAAVTDRVRYEGPGGGYRRGEIWCGGERLAEFEIVAID